ncbi:glycosyltransferase family 2 protein [Alteromonas gracilis]|uniref:glycosyltransferase family 2 protein n=1 Tax=Alteromonas gracilis TaxID=1479524 RepID=UPI00373503C4
MKTPTLSVVIPLYNKAQHIERTLQSVLNQYTKVDEIIVVDDGSNDGGANVVRGLGIENLVIIEQANQGVSVARNNGVAAATTDYVAFLDADDEWLPFFTTEIYTLIQQFGNCGLFATRYQCVEEGGRVVDAKIVLDSVAPEGYQLTNYFDIASRGDLPFMVSSTVVKKAFFNQLNGFPANEPMGEDQDFFARAALHNAIAYSPNIHVHYHRDACNRAMDRLIPVQVCPFAMRLHDALGNASVSPTLKASIQKYCATHGLFIAKQNILRGKYATALSILRMPACKHRFSRYAVLKALAHVLNTKSTLTNMFSVFKKEYQS